MLGVVFRLADSSHEQPRSPPYRSDEFRYWQTALSVASKPLNSRNFAYGTAAALCAVIAASLAIGLFFRQPASTGAVFVISQRDREFTPNTLTIHTGDVVRIVNDDGDLHHHAYVASRRFNFDSGDQLPGSRTDIVFSVPGHFNVLCGIHPKMRLVVTVQ